MCVRTAAPGQSLKFAISPLKVRDFATLTLMLSQSPTDECNERRLPSNLLFLITNTVASSHAPEVLFFLGTSVCFYQKANARVNVLSLEEEADNDHLRATIKDLHSQEDNLIPQVN
jgi:hypothetical protein